MSHRVQSTVRVFTDRLGYGYINNPSAGAPDIYVARRDCADRPGIGRKCIPLEPVEFDIEQGPYGPRAYNVTFPVIVPQTQGLEHAQPDMHLKAPNYVSTSEGYHPEKPNA